MNVTPQLDLSNVKEERLEIWRQSIDAELQDLITTAAAIRQEITTAKTEVKRKYFSKKFKKISDQVMQLLAVQSQLPPHGEEPTPTTISDNTVDSDATPV